MKPVYALYSDGHAAQKAVTALRPVNQVGIGGISSSMSARSSCVSASTSERSNAATNRSSTARNSSGLGSATKIPGFPTSSYVTFALSFAE